MCHWENTKQKPVQFAETAISVFKNDRPYADMAQHTEL